ncbi:MAG: B12-binding domain-containing radical SAM protein [Syntrophales bacterium]
MSDMAIGMQGKMTALSVLRAKGICIRPEVLFISFPICRYHGKNHVLTKSMVPFGLGVLATMAKARGVTVTVLDAEALQLSPQEIAETVREIEPQAVGISLCSPSAGMARTVLASLVGVKSLFFAGGPHVSALRARCVSQFAAVSAFFVGESEVAWSTVLDRFLALSRRFTPEIFEGIAGVITRGNLHCAEPRVVMDLDVIQQMDRTLFVNDPIDTWKGTVSSVLSARGCPAKCSYCSPLGPRHRAYRSRSISHLVCEIETLVGMGVRYLQFGDDTFTALPHRIKQFRTELSLRHIDVRWLAFSRVDALD